jgi:dTDP-4-dehydrorhamnose reductase
MKVLVTGGHGQLGRGVVARGAARGDAIVALDVDTLDLRDPAQLADQLARHAPELVINAAAYTAVDRAETARDDAHAINAAAVDHLARACADRGTPWIHVSTDYVFDGAARAPYREDDALAPLGVYGETKAAGEAIARAAGATIVRTSWVFATRGPSFVQTMLRLAAERPVLRVVADQHGCPTWADDLAGALLALGALGLRGAAATTYHYCGDGPTTWHAFATAIVGEARRYRTLACERIDAITTAEYPTPARRPAYSVLDTTRIRALGIVPPAWQIGMARVIADELGGPPGAPPTGAT